MQIVIVGAGTVGLATGDGFRRFGHKVTFYDTDPRMTEKLRLSGYRTIDDLDGVDYPDIFFICTPEDAVRSAIDSIPEQYTLIVVRSSIPPGTIVQLRRRRELMGRHIAVNPEFLREATATQDFINPSRIVFNACCGLHRKLLEELYEPFRAPIIHLDNPTEVEMIKYASNLFLATTVSYWNEISNVCQKLDINSHTIGKVASMDPRIPTYGAIQHGSPFRGKCLPHNLDVFIQLCKDIGVEPTLLEAVRKVNENMLS